MATILSLFDIKGEDGEEVTPKVEMDPGFVRSETCIFFPAKL